MKKRALTIFGGILLLLLVCAGLIFFKVQRSLAPAPEHAQSLMQGSDGVPELTEEVAVSGLSNVWDVGFLPDNTMLFTERSGSISKVADGKKVKLLNVPSVVAKGEGGLLGMTIDPDFSDNPYIYACYNTSVDIRISRWKVDTDVTKLTDQKQLVTGMPVNITSGRHSGCRPRFGADGFLWVGTGDIAKGSNPQDPKSLGGKVLRIDRDGAAAPGNMSAGFDARIFSYGHRNVQGLAMYDKPKNGMYGYSIEHGPDKQDEINPLKPGNFGWNPVPIYNELVPMTDKKKYPNAVDAIWNSGDHTIAPSGMTFIRGARWLSLDGQLAVAVLKNKHVRLIELTENGKLAAEQVLFQNKYGRVRSVVMGPDQALFLTTDNGGGQDEIIKVTPR